MQGPAGRFREVYILMYVCLYYRSRKVYKEVENDAIRINIPSSMEMPHPYVNYDKEHTHYTTIDKTDDMHYLRQLSDGIGRCETNPLTYQCISLIYLFFHSPFLSFMSIGKFKKENWLCDIGEEMKIWVIYVIV